MNQNPDGNWNERVRGALDAEAESVARRHGERLNGALTEALAAQAHAPAASKRWAVMLPIAASFAVVALTAALLMPGGGRVEPMPMTDDLDLLASDAFDMALEDPEFFAWLAEQDLDEDPERSG